MKHKKVIGRKHLFFDLDDTMTPSRSPIAPHMADLLSNAPVDVIIVSGAQLSQIQKQIAMLPVYALGQNGNHATSPEGELLWNNTLTDDEVAEVHAHVHALSELGIDPHNSKDLVEVRGAQVAFSLVGHNAPLEIKRVCDPDSSKRAEMLRICPFESESLEVKIGGTTCFDYFRKGSHKGTNVDRLIEHTGWKKEDCIYFGDQLRPGGNDEVVIGVIDTIEVAHSDETYEILAKVFGRTDVLTQ